MNKQQGQALIESIYGISILIGLIGGLLFAAYLYYSKHVTDYVLVKNNLCLEELDKDKSQCDQNALNRIKSLLAFQTNMNLTSEQKTNSNTSSLESKLFGQKIDWSKKLKKKR